eukprot:2815445-Pleurochrysis_carterae.AAC.3
MAKAQPVPLLQRGLSARARNARKADGLRERSGYSPSDRRKGAGRAGACRALMAPDWRPVSSADGAAGTSGDGEVLISGGRDIRGGVAVAMGSEGCAGWKRAVWNVPMTLAGKRREHARSTRHPPWNPPPRQSACGSRAGSSNWKAIAAMAPAQARRAAMCTSER